MVYVHHSGVCPSYILAAQLVSGEVRTAEGDAAASVVWMGGVGPPLMRSGAVPVVVAPPWTPRRESPIGNPQFLDYFRLGCRRKC